MICSHIVVGSYEHSWLDGNWLFALINLLFRCLQKEGGRACQLGINPEQWRKGGREGSIVEMRRSFLWLDGKTGRPRGREGEAITV